jgi:fatty-acyl-CoA synthase
MTDEPSAPAVASHWPADRSIDLPDRTVGDLLTEAAAAHADRRALVAGLDSPPRRSWTYAELYTAARRVAGALGEHFAPGERLAISAPNAPEWLLVQLGAALAGMPLVPLNTSYAPAEMTYVLAQSGAAGIVVGSAATAEQVSAARAELPDLRQVLTLQTLVEWEKEAPSLPEVDPASAALIQYTSGTTGSPKGAVLSHRQVVRNGVLSGLRLELGPDDSWLNPLPMYHVNGTVFFALGAISRGSCHVLGKFDPALILDLIETERASFVTGVPTLLLAMMDTPGFGDRDLSSLSLVTTGGTTVPAELVDRLKRSFGVDVVVIYGQTEAGGVITTTLRSDSPELTAASVGVPLAQTEMVIAHPDTGAAVPVGEVGEIRLRGGTVISEYFQQTGDAGRALDDEGWLRTGDLGFMDASGRLQITGRLKELIIRGGENIYPRDIEDVLSELPEIAEVAVIGVPDEYYGETVGAVVRLTAGAEADLAGWQSFAGSRMSRRKVPAHWYVVDQLPLTASGKVRKFVLRDQVATGELAELA